MYLSRLIAQWGEFLVENNAHFDPVTHAETPLSSQTTLLKEFSCSSSSPWRWEHLLPYLRWKGRISSKLCRLERRVGINWCRGTYLVWGIAGNRRERKFWDKSLMKFLSNAVFGGSLTTIRVPYLWETGTWRISSSCRAGSTHSCSSCTDGHLEEQNRVWAEGGSLVALGKDRGSGKGITDWNCFLKCCRRGGSALWEQAPLFV